MGIGPMKIITPLLTEVPVAGENEAAMVMTIPVARSANPRISSAVRILVLLSASRRVVVMGFRCLLHWGKR